MALVGYGSSDEDEEVAPVAEPKSLKPAQGKTDKTSGKPDTKKTPETSSAKVDEQPAIYGPQMGPTVGPSFPPLEEADEETSGEPPSLPPGSPYSANRAMLRDLTLPPVPNMEIPPSPPRGASSPPAAAATATSRKFEHFLELKKKGVHFNSRIADSAAMRNPALADKLLAFVGLDQPRDQYRTTLPADLWDPAAFPRCAFREQLRQSQSDTAQARARAKGVAVEFVAAAGSGGGQSGTGGGAPSPAPAPAAMQPSAGKRKTRFDA